MTEFRTRLDISSPPSLPERIKLCQFNWFALDHAEQAWLRIAQRWNLVVILLLGGITAAVLLVWCVMPACCANAHCISKYCEDGRGNVCNDGTWLDTMEDRGSRFIDAWIATWTAWFSSAPFALVGTWLCFQFVHDQALLLMLQELQQESERLFHNVFIPSWTEPLEELFDHLNAVIEQKLQDIKQQQQEYETSMNRALFGWINTTAPEAHTVLNGAWDLVSDTVYDAFAHTPLHDPAQQFAKCVLGNKLEATDHMLTWLQAHAYVALPRIDRDVLHIHSWSNQTKVWMAQTKSHVQPSERLASLLQTHLKREATELQADRICILAVAVATPLALILLAVWEVWLRRRRSLF